MNKAPLLAEPLLSEMMRSFLVLAETLNVTKAQEVLGHTRQTIKRHIRVLETHKGCTLFDVDDKVYTLTEAGREALVGASHILKESQNWITNQPTTVPAMDLYTHYEDDTDYTYLEQKGINDVFNSDTPFLKDCLTSWMQEDGNIEKLNVIREYAMVFREINNFGWVIVEIGSKSSAAQWFGSSWKKSCIGERIYSLPASDRLAPISNSAFETMSKTQNLRLDHICTLFPRYGYEQPQPISYKRLMLLTTFENRAPALLSLVERSHDLRISALPENLRIAMPEDQVMSVDLGQ